MSTSGPGAFAQASSDGNTITSGNPGVVSGKTNQDGDDGASEMGGTGGTGMGGTGMGGTGMGGAGTGGTGMGGTGMGAGGMNGNMRIGQNGANGASN